MKEFDSPFEVEVKIWEKGHEEGTSRTLTKEFTLGSDEPIFFKNAFVASTTYCLKMGLFMKTRVPNGVMRQSPPVNLKEGQ